MLMIALWKNNLKLKSLLQFTIELFIRWQAYTHSVINQCATSVERLIAIHALAVHRWQVYILSVINHCGRLIAFHTFGMFIRWQEDLFFNWPDIIEVISTKNFQIQTIRVRHALVGGLIGSEWLILFSHWTVDFWLIDWLANRISATFFIFGRPAITLCLEFHCNTCNTSGWL